MYIIQKRYHSFLSQTLGAAAIEPTLAAGLNSIVHTYYTILPMWQCGMAHVYVGATGLFMPSAHSTCGGWPEGGKKKQPLQPKPFERESLLLTNLGLRYLYRKKMDLLEWGIDLSIFFYLNKKH